MRRWREVKKEKYSNRGATRANKKSEASLTCANLPNRIKAFVVDLFLIMMPIMYITAYFIMEGKEDFQGNEIARWITSLLYGIVIVSFWVKSGQTPGFKAYDIKVVDEKTKGNISPVKAIFRYILFLVSAVSLVGLLLPFFRKDKKTFHDLASKSCAIDIK